MLVIIGLITGGVLVGATMIKDAEMRAVINQINKYRQGVLAFKIKYGGLPGDLNNTKAVSFGFQSRDPTLGFRNGNRTIDTGANWLPSTCGETNLFWNDLSTSGLIERGYTGVDYSYGGIACGTSTPGSWMPKLKVGSSSYVTAYTDFTEGKNYFIAYGNVEVIGGYGNFLVNATASGWAAALAPFTPLQAYSIDAKIDDGTPLGGLVTARYNMNYNSPYSIPLSTPAAPASGVCVSNATGNPYNTGSTTGGNTAACVIQFPM